MKTILLIFSLCLVNIATGLSAGSSSDGQNIGQFQVTPALLQLPIPAIIVPSPTPILDSYAFWYSMKGLIPNEYFERAIETRLYKNSKFVAAVFNLALQQMTLDLDTLHAKEVVFNQYIKCACPQVVQSSCTVQALYEDGDDDSMLREFVNPYFATLAHDVGFGVGVRVLKLMKFSLAQLERRHRNLATIVQCSCPHSQACNDSLDREIYHIITGARDKYLSDAYWQEMFSREIGFPNIIPEEILMPLQSAWHNLLEHVFGNFDAQAPGWGLFGGQLFPNFFNHTAANFGYNNGAFNISGLWSSIGNVIKPGTQHSSGTGFLNSIESILTSETQEAEPASEDSPVATELVHNSSTAENESVIAVSSKETAASTTTLPTVLIVDEQETNSTTI